MESVSFTTAGGKEVAFKKRGRPKGSGKKVTETPVTPENDEPPEAMDDSTVDSKMFPVAIPAQEPIPAPVEQVPAPVEQIPPPKEAVKIKPARKSRAKPAPGISNKLPKKTVIERPSELRETLIPPAAPPPLERWTPSKEDMHNMIHDYMRANKQSTRDSRVNMYRSWLTA